MRTITPLALMIALSLLGSAPARSQEGESSAPSATRFMGHELGETIQQWVSESDQPKRCAEWNRRKRANVQFCDVVEEIARSGSGVLDTQHPGDSVFARDRWYFNHGLLVALAANALPYDKTLAQLRERYGRETNASNTLAVHVFGPTYPVARDQWVMPDGTLIFLAEDKVAVRHAKLLISTRDYILKQVDANNPF